MGQMSQVGNSLVIVVDNAIELARKKGVQMENIYEAADTMKKDSVNILDFKLAFEKLVPMSNS